MPGGVRYKVMCLVLSQIFLLIIISPCGALISDSVGKAELLKAWFDSKQSHGIVELPLTCHPKPAFCGIVFRACEVVRHLMDLDYNGCFLMFFSEDCCYSSAKTELYFSQVIV